LLDNDSHNSSRESNTPLIIVSLMIQLHVQQLSFLSTPFVVKGSDNRVLNVLFNKHNYLPWTAILSE